MDLRQVTKPSAAPRLPFAPAPRPRPPLPKLGTITKPPVPRGGVGPLPRFSYPVSPAQFEDFALNRRLKRGSAPMEIIRRTNPGRVAQGSTSFLGNRARNRVAQTTASSLFSKGLGVLGLFWTISEAFEFAAPAVQGWLREGWRGDTKVYAGSSLPPVYAGGQCPATYQAIVNVISSNTQLGQEGVLTTWRSGSNVQGPLGEFVWTRQAGVPADQDASWSLAIAEAGGGLRGLSSDNFSIIQYGSGPGELNEPRVVRTDGGVDSCGSLPATESPNPVYESPTLTGPREHPTPGASPSPTPTTPATSAPANPISDPDNAPGNPVALLPGFNPEDLQLPDINPGQAEKQEPEPKYENPPSRPNAADTTQCELNGTDPCQKAISDQLKEIKDQMERDKEKPEEPPQPPELQTLQVPLVACENGQPIITQTSITWLESSNPEFPQLLADLATKAAQSCNVLPPFVALPDIYDLRPIAGYPKLVLIFRASGTRTYHSFTIPHPNNLQKPNEPPIGEWTKGPIMASLALADNSRIVVNASSADMGESVVSAMAALVDPAFLSPDSAIRISERRGTAVQVHEMEPAFAALYSDGNQSLRPTWRASFLM